MTDPFVLTPSSALEIKDPQSSLVMALGLLAGLRTAEIVDKDGLLWENIDFEEKEITVTAKQSKTKHGRTVAINPALMSWLLKYKQESGRIGRRFNAFRKYRTEACKDVGVTWPHNGARHTFASNYCKIHGEGKAADALGHVGSVDMLLDHYRGVMQSKAKAKAYFEILTPFLKPLMGDPFSPGAEIFKSEPLDHGQSL